MTPLVGLRVLPVDNAGTVEKPASFLTSKGAGVTTATSADQDLLRIFFCFYDAKRP